MAKVYAPPEDIKRPAFSYDNYKEVEEKYIQEVAEFCKSQSKCPHVGEVIRFPVADGYAVYVVYDYCTLIHLELGDMYQIPEAHARGLRKADIIAEVKRQQKLKELFGGKGENNASVLD